ncbi:MAG TPA: sodium-dependent transporter [Acidobacteriota bacterium]|nr:sodium-dependent transporter [Acidobacteriota bacterium]
MQSRGEWSSRVGFIIAAAGSAVGLGNIWGFPVQTAQNGGGAFVVVYLIFTLVICLPVILMEIAIGRRTQRNPVGAFKALAPASAWPLVGGLGVFAGVMILSFYIVLAGYVLGFFLECATGGLERLSTDGEFAVFAGSVGKTFAYMAGIMLATIGIVVGGVKGGIERATRILMPVLLVMMFAMIAYMLTLPNAGKGLAFYFVPDFSKLSMGVLNSALSQAFFSLSLGMGALITYGSYVSRKDNIASSGFIVALFDSFIAITAGLLIIPSIFTMDPNVTAENMPAGPGLIFVFLPKMFMSLTPSIGYFAASFLASFFFLLVCFAAITSTISLLEVPTSWAVDERGIRRGRAALAMGGLIFFLGIFSLLSQGASDFFTRFITYPSGQTVDFLTLVADIFFESALPLGGCLISAFCAFRWKRENLSAEIAQGYPKYMGSWQEKALNAILYVLPFILFFIFINTVLEKYFAVEIF